MCRSSTSEEGPDGPGRMRAHQRRRSFSELSLTRTNRGFRLRADHLLQTKEQVLRLLLSEMSSMMWSMSSCGNCGMMAVVVESSRYQVFISLHPVDSRYGLCSCAEVSGRVGTERPARSVVETGTKMTMDEYAKGKNVTLQRGWCEKTKEVRRTSYTASPLHWTVAPIAS